MDLKSPASHGPKVANLDTSAPVSCLHLSKISVALISSSMTSWTQERKVSITLVVWARDRAAAA